MEFEDDIFIDDDGDILDIIDFGFPRRHYERSDYFNSMDDMSFYRRFRLTKPSVFRLLEEIEEQLEFPNDANNSISPINQLLTTLRFYACAAHQNCIADFIGIHQTTASRVIYKVTNVIADLCAQYIKMRTNAETLHVQNYFYSIARFPRVLG